MAELDRGASQHAGPADAGSDRTQAVRLQAGTVDGLDARLLLGERHTVHTECDLKQAPAEDVLRLRRGRLPGRAMCQLGGTL